MSTLNTTEHFAAVTADIQAKAAAARLPEIWHVFTYEQRDPWVRRLMAVGHSNRSAAVVLGLTQGQVARVRWQRGIPSRNEPTRKASVRTCEWPTGKIGARGKPQQCGDPVEDVGSKLCRKHRRMIRP